MSSISYNNTQSYVLSPYSMKTYPNKKFKIKSGYIYLSVITTHNLLFYNCPFVYHQWPTSMQPFKFLIHKFFDGWVFWKISEYDKWSFLDVHITRIIRDLWNFGFKVMSEGAQETHTKGLRVKLYIYHFRIRSLLEECWGGFKGISLRKQLLILSM